MSSHEMSATPSKQHPFQSRKPDEMSAKSQHCDFLTLPTDVNNGGRDSAVGDSLSESSKTRSSSDGSRSSEEKENSPSKSTAKDNSCLEQAVLQLRSLICRISDGQSVVRMESFLEETNVAFKLMRQDIDMLREKVSFYEDYVRRIDQELWEKTTRLFWMKGILSVEGIVEFVEQSVFSYTWPTGCVDVTGTRVEIWKSGLNKCSRLITLFQRFEGFNVENVPDLVASAVDRCKSSCVRSSIHGIQTTALVLDPDVLSPEELRVIFATAVFLHLECRIGRFIDKTFIEDCNMNLDTELHRDEPFETLKEDMLRHESQLKSVVFPEREMWPVDGHFKHLKVSVKLDSVVMQKVDEVYQCYIGEIDQIRRDVLSETPKLLALKEIFERMDMKRRELTTSVWIAKGFLNLRGLIDQALFRYSWDLPDGMPRNKGPNSVFENWRACAKSTKIRKFLKATGLTAEELPHRIQDVYEKSECDTVMNSTKLLIRKDMTGNDERVAALLKMFADEFHVLNVIE